MTYSPERSVSVPQYSKKSLSRATLSYDDVRSFLRRALPRLIQGFVIGLILALVYLTITPTRFMAVSSVIYDPVSAPTFMQNSTWLESNLDTSTRIDSQAEVIKSEGISARVINRLGLDRDPEFVPSLISPNAETPSSGKEGADVAKKPDKANGKQISATDKTANATDSSNTSRNPDLALPSFLKHMWVRRVGLTSVIEIGFTSEDSRKAVKIANAVASEYIAAVLDQKAQTALDGSKWLQQRLEQLRKLAFDAMRDAERFKANGFNLSEDPAVKLAELESIAQTYRHIYENFLERLTETSQRVSFPVADARIVSLATLPSVTRRPPQTLIILFAVTLGMAMGLAYSLAEQSLNRKVRSLENLFDFDIPCAGSIASADPLRKSGLKHLFISVFSLSKAKLRQKQDSEFSALMADPDALSELWEILMPLTANRDIHRVGLVGLSRGAGVTTLSAKLARNCRSLGLHALLIDCNTIDSDLSNRLAGETRPGFVDIISGAATPSETIVELPEQQQTFIPAGNSENLPATPGVVIVAQQKQEMVIKMTEGFDICLMDLPPLDKSSDVLVIGKLVDALLLIVEYDVTPLADTIEACERLKTSGVRFAGVIINKVMEN